ncbi:MAG: type I DNA topoisomerase [Desulfobacterales bacterium]
MRPAHGGPAGPVRGFPGVFRISGMQKTRSLVSKTGALSTGVKCPEKDCDGELVERTSKRGKIFYGCSRFPKCNFATWDKPVARKCPDCGADPSWWKKKPNATAKSLNAWTRNAGIQKARNDCFAADTRR